MIGSGARRTLRSGQRAGMRTLHFARVNVRTVRRRSQANPTNGSILPAITAARSRTWPRKVVSTRR